MTPLWAITVILLVCWDGTVFNLKHSFIGYLILLQLDVVFPRSQRDGYTITVFHHIFLLSIALLLWTSPVCLQFEPTILQIVSNTVGITVCDWDTARVISLTY